MIVLGATIRAKEGKEDELIKLFNKLGDQVKQEAGCLTYLFNQDKKEPTTFFIFEQYTDQAAFDHHMGTPYFKEIGGAMAEFMAGRPDMTFYEEVAGFKK